MHRTSSRTALSLLAAAVGLFAACGDDEPQGPPIQNPGQIRVVNAALGPILIVKIRECATRPDWDLLSDRLGPDETILPSDSASFTVEVGCHDIQAHLLPVPPPADTVVREQHDAVVTATLPYRWQVVVDPDAPSSTAPR